MYDHPVLTVSAPEAADKNGMRRFANYHPTLWDTNRFTTYVYDDEAVKLWRKEADKLKEKIGKVLIIDDSTTASHDQNYNKLKLIDTVQRLGIAYHFEEEIDGLLGQIFIHHESRVGDYDLNQTALLFRILRQHGYRVSCDIFNKFKDTEGRFKEDIAKDVVGMLSLYEAAHLSVHGENILDEALDFTTTTLSSVVAADSSHPLSKIIKYALRRPIRKSLPRPQAWHYLSFYEELKSHDETLLKFAKLDFNILQKMHQKELSIIARWWERLDAKRNFPWARDRLAEWYLWIVELLSPQYASGRRFLAKLIALTSVIDDIYDVYGKPEELVLFTEGVESWEISAIEELPEYTRLCYQALLDVFNEFEEDISKEGNAYRVGYRVGYAKEAMKTLVRAYFEESKWINCDVVPTYEEYMKIALVTSGYPMLTMASLVGMGDAVTKEDFDWLLSGPKILEAASVITRLMDDMVVDKEQLEQQGVRIPSAVDCYMFQYGVSEQKACQVFNRLLQDAWKDINEAYLVPAPPSRTALTVVLNLSRFMDEIYKDNDGHTNSTGILKEYVTKLLIDPVEI